MTASNLCRGLLNRRAYAVALHAGIVMFVICISPPSASSDGIPAPNGPFFDVPVRWCVVEGSPALVSGADTDALLLLRLAGATWNIYNPDPNPDSFNRPGSNTLIGLSSRIPN